MSESKNSFCWVESKLIVATDMQPVGLGESTMFSLAEIIAMGVKTLQQNSNLSVEAVDNQAQEAAAEFIEEYQSLNKDSDFLLMLESRLTDIEATLEMPWNSDRMVSLSAVKNFIEQVRMPSHEDYFNSGSKFGNLSAPGGGIN